MRAEKFKYTVTLMTTNLRTYQILGNRLEGNTYLHRKQYLYNELGVGKHLMENKIRNQRETLLQIRRKVPAIENAVLLLEQHLTRLKSESINELQVLLGIEGSASRIYFSALFVSDGWKGRKPRAKNDYINSMLDIGYTMLFNFVDSLLQLYGFDVYCGVLHTEFYMRKSLACDLMEVFRPIVDWKIRTSIHLQQFKKEDFDQIKGQWTLKYKKNPEYMMELSKAILSFKGDMFIYVQKYYRAFMKGSPVNCFPEFNIKKNIKEEVRSDYLN